MIELILGIVFAVISIALLKNHSQSRKFYTLSLIGLPAVYAIFSLFAIEQDALINELLWGIPFIVTGIVVSVRPVPWTIHLVGFMWLAHGFFDVYHNNYFTNSGVPWWYPLLCVGTDISLGLFLLFKGDSLPLPKQTIN